ncbi:nicotinate-nucleotide adenylyltransferase [Longilinea arvoryzae]|uniref:Probable nicotinate-nucleotide adenylyltransferase n=1 Tax=Longilinea arvoryzae TaxID=360412 RepID=A0A0S7BFH0_9CHLR|nr:nicotinate-nucleotide adenylyltransferase [Longilinea arvoryzae]GAP14249.1 nicotinate-nucleotide adenylyltransferase [Longilinea arvoryzae]
MRIGIFGGTFDPPHVGHQILAAEAAAQLGLDRVLWVLTPNPPHKQGHFISADRIRLKLVRAAAAGNPLFEVSTIEFERPGPHYASDTMSALAVRYPGAELIYLMGGDSLHDLPTWHEPREFLLRCSGVGVMRRPSDCVDLTSLEHTLPGITAKTHFVEAPLVEISASDIRARVAAGQPYRYLVPPAVYRLIERLQLYRSS